MDTFGKVLAARAKVLGLSNAEAARRIGLDERRYGNYVSGLREPDFKTLLKIAAVLKTTPNELLGASDGSAKSKASKRSALMDRFALTADRLPDGDLEMAVVQAEAVAAFRNPKRRY